MPDYLDNSYCGVDGSGTVDCPKPLDIKMNSAKTIIASPAGLLFKRSNGNTYFIGANNWSYEKDHVQQIFSDVGAYNSETGLGCNVQSNYVQCYDTNFTCYISSYAYEACRDYSDNSRCYLDSDGSMDCN